MLTINYVGLKNFLSFGNVLQTLNLDLHDLVLVLGENLDVPSAIGNSKNGCGKSALLNAICFALYGVSLSTIKKDNLINFINNKNLEVIIEFKKNNNIYRIERGRKPSYLRFFINDLAQTVPEKDDAQGESSETQAEIVKAFGVSLDLFKQIIGLNTSNPPFLSLSSKDQRLVIEELLCITQISEKAENLKNLIKETKDLILLEEVKLTTIKTSNDKIQHSIEDLKRRGEKWNIDHNNKLLLSEKTLNELLHLNIEEEIVRHKENSLLLDLNNQLNQHLKDKKNVLSAIKEIDSQKTVCNSNFQKVLGHKCPTCDQDIISKTSSDIKETISAKLAKFETDLISLNKNLSEIDEKILEINKQKQDKISKETHYLTLEQALNHKNKIESYGEQLLQLYNETNPYGEDIILQQTSLLQVIDNEMLTNLNIIKDHQEFLLKLLTNKDSVVRKSIINQNLAFLNSRLTFYTEKLGLPHSVIFLNDLSIGITYNGRDQDFDNLSRGEKTRLILSLHFSFREVFESLNSQINLLFVDEVVDLGIDNVGLDLTLEVLKKMARENNKSIFLVSHRDELVSRCNNTLLVQKENGFSTLVQEESV